MIRLIAGVLVLACGLWLLMGCSQNPYYAKRPNIGIWYPRQAYTMTATATLIDGPKNCVGLSADPVPCLEIVKVIPCDADNCGKKP